MNITVWGLSSRSVAVRKAAYRVFGLALSAMVGIAVTGCDQPQSAQGPQYGAAPAETALPLFRFAVHPLHNPRKLTQAYQPLIEYLNLNVPNAVFRLEASRDYQAYEAKFRGRDAEFLLPNPWQTLEAMKIGYSVQAMAGDAEDFRGIFIVRRDSKISKPLDLKGKAVSYPSPTALAAAIMPQQYLHEHGVNVTKDLENRYVGSQESSIMNAYLGQVSAGATWPPPWRAFQKDHPKEAAELRVIWETPPLMNNAVMVRDDVPVAVRERVARLLTGLHTTAQGRTILAGMETARFYPSDDASYDRVRQFVSTFEKNVRPVEQK